MYDVLKQKSPLNPRLPVMQRDAFVSDAGLNRDFANYYFTSILIYWHIFGIGYCGIIDKKYVFAYQNNDKVQIVRIPEMLEFPIAVRAALGILSVISISDSIKYTFQSVPFDIRSMTDLNDIRLFDVVNRAFLIANQIFVIGSIDNRLEKLAVLKQFVRDIEDELEDRIFGDVTKLECFTDLVEECRQVQKKLDQFKSVSKIYWEYTLRPSTISIEGQELKCDTTVNDFVNLLGKCNSQYLNGNSKQTGTKVDFSALLEGNVEEKDTDSELWFEQVVIHNPDPIDVDGLDPPARRWNAKMEKVKSGFGLLDKSVNKATLDHPDNKLELGNETSLLPHLNGFGVNVKHYFRKQAMVDLLGDTHHLQHQQPQRNEPNFILSILFNVENVKNVKLPTSYDFDMPNADDYFPDIIKLLASCYFTKHLRCFG